MSEADTPTVKTKKSKMVPVPGREQAEKNYETAENDYENPEGTWKWLDPKDYRPLTKETKRKIHELRAAAYKKDPIGFSNTLGEHSDKCIKSIKRYEKKQEKSAAADTSGPAPAESANKQTPAEKPAQADKQMKNPFVV